MPKSKKYATRDSAESEITSDSFSSDVNVSLTATSISVLLEQHRAAIATEFKSLFVSMDAKLDKIQAVVSGQGKGITDLEENAEAVCGRLEQLEATCSSLQEDNKSLKSKLSDLEGRSRRQNFHLVGLPESLEGARPTSFFSKLLVKVFGDQVVLPSPPELDRAPRTLAPKPGPRERPRPVIIRFHRYQIKDLIMIPWPQAPVLRGLQRGGFEAAAEYKGVLAELYQHGLRPSLLFPAKLRITLQSGERMWFRSVYEASNYISTLGVRP